MVLRVQSGAAVPIMAYIPFAAWAQVFSKVERGKSRLSCHIIQEFGGLSGRLLRSAGPPGRPKLTTNYNLGYSQFIDTAHRRYNWLGASAPKSAPGEMRYSSAKYYNRDGNITFNADYRINYMHSFSVSHLLSLTGREKIRLTIRKSHI